MAKRVLVKPHLTVKELENCYRQSRNRIEKTHYLTMWLLALGKTTVEVSVITGYGVPWIYELIRSYNCYGPQCLGDLRRNNKGRGRLLDDKQLQLLQQTLKSPPQDGGLWNGPKVANWMSKLLNRKVHPQRGWEYLKKLGNVASIRFPTKVKCSR